VVQTLQYIKRINAGFLKKCSRYILLYDKQYTCIENILFPSKQTTQKNYWSGLTKDYTIYICCFSAKHAAFRIKNKDWSARNQNNVSEWNDMSTRGLLFQWGSTIKSYSVYLSIAKRTSSLFHWQLTCSRHDIAKKNLNWR
jgi:hypothetical protein